MASERLGFMQGRLSPLVNGKIQAFPAEHWRDEYPAAEDLGLAMMEWTLDHDGLDANPLMTPSGRADIRALGTRHGVSVETITGDLFMQRPFWKANGGERDARLADFDRVVNAAADLGVRIVVVPLVDNGSVESGGEGPLLDALLGARTRSEPRTDDRVRVGLSTRAPGLVHRAVSGGRVRRQLRHRQQRRARVRLQ